MRLAGAALALCGGCGSAITASPIEDAGPDVFYVSHQDSGVREDAGVDRVTPHHDVIVTAPRVLVLYAGNPGVDGAMTQDVFVDWLMASSYWGLLAQYGVGPGKRVASVQVPREQLVPVADQDALGLVWLATLEKRVHAWVDVNGTMGANALLVFLPDTVNVKLSVRGSYTYQTCIDAFGYHAYDGREPYAIMPPCQKGRETGSIAHELIELATDPESNRGWFSNEDLPKGGGEIGDLCQGEQTSWQGWMVPLMWSNADRHCMP